MSKRGQRGFTLIELVVVIGVISILAAIMVPMTVSYLANARVQRAKSDVKAIGTAILEFNQDMREWPLWASGTATKPADSMYAVLKAEAGDEAAAATDPAVTFDTTTDADDLDDQLVTNDPLYPFTGVRKWMGPYLENITEDP